MPRDESSRGRRGRGVAMAVGGLILLAFVALRGRWIGHLLSWDEAMQLCTLRSLVSGGEDYFSLWFWRHPPLFSVMALLLRPLAGGFAERVELLAVAIGAVNLGLVYLLTRRVHGRVAATAAAGFLAVMPGSIFFDTWVKADGLVACLGLGALWLMRERRTAFAGLALGLAFLAKETAVFYAMGVAWLWVGGGAERPRWKSGALLGAVTAATCGWWYFWVVPRVGMGEMGGVGHLRFSMFAESGWAAPWHFYLRRLVADLGAPGAALALGGALGLVSAGWRKEGAGRANPPESRALFWWPLGILLPSLLILSVVRSKVPWVIGSLYPAVSVLQGVAAAAIVKGVERWLTSKRTGLRAGWAAAGVALALVAISLPPVIGRDYETVMRSMDEGQWRGASYSREAAEAVNAVARPGDPMLVTSFHYWAGLSPGSPCAVFAYYLTVPVEILLRHHDISVDWLVHDVRRHRLQWALLSPPPGPRAVQVFRDLRVSHGLRAWRMRGAYLFSTSPLWVERAGGDAHRE